MDSDKALTQVVSSLQQGAELRIKVAEDCGRTIVKAASVIIENLRSGGKLLFFGNGGSAADAQHLAAEFVGRFVMERPGLPAMALTTNSSILTALGNDYGFDQVFARQIAALGQPGDVAIGLSTSGDSPNVIMGVEEAKKRRMKTIALAGKDGGALSKCVDIPITVAAENTAQIQECHIAIGHILCQLVEDCLFGDQRPC